MRPKPNIGSLPVYKPGKPIEEVRREFGLADVIKLASNENPFGCSAKAKEAIAREFDHLHLYPDGASVELANALSERLGVGPDWLVFGAGSDEVVALIARAFFVRGDETVMAFPTFPQYRHNAEVEGAIVREVPLRDGKHDLSAMLACVGARTKIVWVCNPNNPTGTIVTRDELESFLRRVPDDVLVVLDEAYCEYNTSADYPDGLELLRRYGNLVVLRTFSKIYGLAALRIGYGVGRPEVIRLIQQVREPFNTSRVAQAAAKAALEDESFVAESRARNAEGIRQLTAAFDRMGLAYYPAYGNFVMVDVGRSAGEVFEQLLRRGIIVRHDPTWRLPTKLRVTVGSREQNEAFLSALSAVLAEVPEQARHGTAVWTE